MKNTPGMVWLIGAGPMAIDYAKVLLAQQRPFVCVTRSDTSAMEFSTQVNLTVHCGGIDKYIASFPAIPEHAIVAAGIESLADITETLIRFGVRSILVEKPGGLDRQQIAKLTTLEKQYEANVYVAYNRRFYESVKVAQKLIAADGGVVSLNYEITEWSHLIAEQMFGAGVKHNWFLANTSHVVDLAFFMAGKPKQISTYSTGSTEWHSRSASFAGAGRTTQGALFSYHGDWNGPGRWSLELLTKTRRFIFRPLEKLQVQYIGSIELEPVEISGEFDDMFKPGLYQQTLAFLQGNSAELCSISEQLQNTEFYRQMANYTE